METTLKKYPFDKKKCRSLYSTILGMNSIVVYCCHDVFYRFFPVNWKMHEDHLSLLIKAVWDTAIFVALAYVMYRKKIFIAL